MLRKQNSEALKASPPIYWQVKYSKYVPVDHKSMLATCNRRPNTRHTKSLIATLQEGWERGRGSKIHVL